MPEPRDRTHQTFLDPQVSSPLCCFRVRTLSFWILSSYPLIVYSVFQLRSLMIPRQTNEVSPFLFQLVFSIFLIFSFSLVWGPFMRLQMTRFELCSVSFPRISIVLILLLDWGSAGDLVPAQGMYTQNEYVFSPY